MDHLRKIQIEFHLLPTENIFSINIFMFGTQAAEETK